MLTESSVEPDQPRSFLENVAALLDDIDISSPTFHAVINLFVIDEKASDEVCGEPSFEVDHLVETIISKSSLASELSTEENLGLFVKDDFMAAFFKRKDEVAKTHTEDREWNRRLPGFVLTNLSALEEQHYRRHVREMSVLLAILQRPPAAFMAGGFPLLYRKILQRLKSANLAGALVTRIEGVQKGLQLALRPALAALLKQLLTLYLDILFYFSFHLLETESESLITGELLDRMTDIAVNLSGVGLSVPSLQRSLFVLVCVIVKHTPRIPLTTLQRLLEDSFLERSSRSNVTNFILLAAVPYYPLKGASASVEQWLQQALQVLCQCTMYDLDVDDVFSREGPYAKQHTFLIKSILGVAMERFLTRVSSFWWACCSMQTLVSAARGCFIYAFTWSRIPPGVLAFLEFIRFHLKTCTSLPSARYDVIGKKDKTLSLEYEEGVGGEVGRSGSPYALQSSSCPHDEEGEIGAMGLVEYGVQTAAGATHLSFDTAEVRSIFFLSLYSYITAASLFHCDRLSNAEKIFFLSSTQGSSSPCEGAGTVATLSLPTPPLRRGNELNLLSQCMEFLMLEITSVPSPVTASQYIRGSLHDAAISLLYAILSLFPQEIDLANRIANRSLSDLFVQLLFHHLKPDDIFVERRDVAVMRILFSLLQVYFDAVPSLSSVAAKLLTENMATAFSKGFTTAINLSVLHLTAYTSLCQEAEEKIISSNRLLLFLMDLDKGVLSGSPKALQFFACLIIRLEEITETVGFSTQTMLEEITQEKTKFLIEQLFEGAAGLLRVYQNGLLSLCGHSTFRLFEVSLSVILEIMRVCEVFFPVATSLLPGMVGCNDGNAVPVSYVLLSALAAPSFPACWPAAQLLGAALQRGHVLFPALRSTLLGHTVRVLAGALHDALPAGCGTAGNGLRLAVLAAMGVRDRETLQCLTGPDSIPGNRQAAEPADLVIAKVLSGLLLHEAASRIERTFALELLVALGLTEALPLPCAMSLLSEATQPADAAAPDVFEQAALTAALTSFTNAVIATQECRHPRSHPSARGVTPSRWAPSPSPSLSLPSPTPGIAESPANGSLVTLSGKGGVTPPTRGAPAGHADPMGLVLRGGAALLRRAACRYEALRQRLHSTAGQPTPAAAARLPSRTLSVARANGLRSVDPEWTLSQLQLRRKQLWNHHATLSWVEASRSGAAARRRGCALPRQNLFHTEALPDAVEVEETAYRVVCPLILGEAYCFVGSDDDATFNLMASTLEAVRRMAVALEGTLWLSVNEPESSRTFLMHYFETLRNAIQWVKHCKPTAPLLVRPLWECVRQCLQLSNAASRVLEASSLGSGQRLEVDDPTRRALYQLLEFMRENTMHLSILNPCLNIISTLGREDNIGVDFEDRVFFILADVLFEEERKKVLVIEPEHLTFLEGFIKIFECLPPNSCPFLVLAPLIPCLFRRATAVSFSIVTDSPGDIHTSYFVLVLRCMCAALLKARTVGVLSLLPLRDIMAMMDSLSGFATTFILDSALTYRRQSWHIVWCSLLGLLTTAMSTLSAAYESSEEGSSGYAATQRTLLEPIQARLPHFPRFLTALGGFTAAAKPEHASAPLFVWDAEELELCTRLVTQLSVLIRPVSSLLPVVQRCFLQTHRYTLHGLHTSSSSDLGIVQLEKNTIREVLVRAVQSQLTFFILQPHHGVPFLIREKGDVCAVVAALSTQSGRGPSALTAVESGGGASVERPALTFEVLWRFIAHAFHITRRARSGLKGRGLDTTPSLESSVTRSPSRGGEVESGVEDDFAAADSFVAGMQAEQRGLHLENIQLALVLYTMAAEELSQSDARVEGAAGGSHKRELRVCTEKLLHVLGNIVHEMKRMGSPHLLNLLDSICDRLNATIAVL